MPGTSNDGPFLQVDSSKFTITERCKRLIHINNTQILSLMFLKEFAKENDISEKPSLKELTKRLGVVPTDKATVYHLNMIWDDPSSKRCILNFLENVKSELLEKYNLEKIVISCDGKIFDLLVKVISEYGNQYRFCIPYLGNYPKSYMFCLLAC